MPHYKNLVILQVNIFCKSS